MTLFTHRGGGNYSESNYMLILKKQFYSSSVSVVLRLWASIPGRRRNVSVLHGIQRSSAAHPPSWPKLNGGYLHSPVYIFGVVFS